MNEYRQQCIEAFRRAFWFYVRTSYVSAKMPTAYHAEDCITANGRSGGPLWADHACWRADYERISLHALAGVKKQVFGKRYILGLTISDALRMSGIDPSRSWHKWEAMKQQIAETVGDALLQSGVWPLHSDDGKKDGYFD